MVDLTPGLLSEYRNLKLLCHNTDLFDSLLLRTVISDIKEYRRSPSFACYICSLVHGCGKAGKKTVVVSDTNVVRHLPDMLKEFNGVKKQKRMVNGTMIEYDVLRSVQKRVSEKSAFSVSDLGHVWERLTATTKNRVKISYSTQMDDYNIDTGHYEENHINFENTIPDVVEHGLEFGANSCEIETQNMAYHLPESSDFDEIGQLEVSQSLSILLDALREDCTT